MSIPALAGTDPIFLGGKTAEGRNQSFPAAADVLSASYPLSAWCLHTEAAVSVKE
jgi:hypothetical protein